MTDRNPHILFYVSGHGFGHARRTAAVIEHLLRTRPQIDLSIRTTAPARIFTSVGLDPARIAPTSLDSGVVERDVLNIDIPATVQRVRDLMARRDELINHEVAALSGQPLSLIAADIPFLAGPIAERLGVPCVAVGNFTWDWIYEPYLADSDSGRQILRTIRDDYGRMAAVLRQPLSHAMPQFRQVIDIPAAAHRSRLTEAAVLSHFQLDPTDPRPRILIGMRGGTSPEATVAGCRSMPDALFTTLQLLPPDSPENLRYIPQGDLDFADLLSIHAAVISKFGYGLVCDAAAAGTRLLWPKRLGFREEDIFELEAPSFLPTRQISREDYTAGRWADSIGQLLCAPPVTPPRLDGQQDCARALLSFARPR